MSSPASTPSPIPVTIAVDAMGGDHAPVAVVQAVAQLSLEQPALNTVLVGDSAAINALLTHAKHNPERISVQHASQAVPMGAKPGEALAEFPDASIIVAAKLVAEGGARALVSAGNTGASVLACAKNFKLLPGVRRAALAAVYPTQSFHGSKKDPFSLLLDVGATLEVSARDLAAFAVMGAVYARAISQNERPKVALLSNGTEPTKGPRSVVEAHPLLQKLPGVEFVGNIEGVDLPKGIADVVVCDGFVGNVVLKMLEGIGETATNLARYAAKEKLMWRAGLAMLSSGFQHLKSLTDWEEYGGAPFLGFDRLFIKAHGRSKERAIANACKVAAKGARADLAGAIAQGIESFAKADNKADSKGESKPAPT
jgi:glycerol-3-phosphate acyltransferase PlsX